MPTVPDVKDQLDDAALTTLETLGFRVDRSEVASDTVSEGLTIGTSPPAETEADVGSVVTLEISTGSSKAASPVKTIVPVLEGKTELEALSALANANLKVGVQSAVPHDTVVAGNIISSAPASGTEVDAGSTIALDTSTGPAVATSDAGSETQTPNPADLGQAAATAKKRSNRSAEETEDMVEMPDLFGFTVSRAYEVLGPLGLRLGMVFNKYSDIAPAGAVFSSSPGPGKKLARNSKVVVDVSKGPAPNWMVNAVPVILSVFGLIVIGAILWAILQKEHIFLEKLAKKEVARGLITFLIAISTVGIAIILAVSTVVSAPTSEDDKRFDRSKQVLTMLIGVLGTIVGFYFGSTSSEDGPAASLQVSMPAAIVGQAYTSPLPLIQGISPPVKWSIDKSLPADLALDPVTGIVSGTPKATAGATTYKITAVDSASPPHALEDTVSFEIQSAD